LVIESISRPQNGIAVISGEQLIYTPNPDFSGVDEFTYLVSDGRGSTDIGSVEVTVVSVNDRPTAQDNSAATTEETPILIDVLANDHDADEDDLRIESISPPTNGTVTHDGATLTYVSNPEFSGTDVFEYTVSDGRGGTDTARVTVVVGTVNDAPIAYDDSSSTAEETLVVIPVLDNDTDSDGDFLLVESITAPEHGTVLNTRTGLSYVPDAGFSGVDTFSYVVSDGNGGTDRARVTVSVAEVNDAPVAQDDSVYTDESEPVSVQVLSNDSDPDGDPLTIESFSQAEHGTIRLENDELIYTPTEGYSGVDSFEYSLSDGRGGVDRARVIVAVASVNDAPSAQNDSQTTQEGDAIEIAVLQNDEDPDGDPLRVESVTQPANGTVQNNGTTLTYVPDTGFAGTDSFTYTVTDSRGRTDTATVTVGVDSAIAGYGGGQVGDVSCDGRIIISEIAWAGTAADPRDEWIELRNLGTTSVDLTGWTLRWQRSRATASGEAEWKEIALHGIVGPASISACDEAIYDPRAMPDFRKNDATDAGWIIDAPIDRIDESYYVIERRHQDTIRDLNGRILYDTNPFLTLELSDEGEIIMLVDREGNVVDTANASHLGRDGWVAGSAVTFGSMERIDPLGPDTAANWHTNMGVVARGQDAQSRPLAGTPGTTNSPILEALGTVGGLEPTVIRPGEAVSVSFPLSRQDRRNTGWPWIHVTRPGDLAGAGGAVQLTEYTFSGSHTSRTEYSLDIGTTHLPAGLHIIWITYGQGKAVVVPLLVTP